MGLPEDASAFEVLTRSGGRRVGDLLEVVEMPQLDGLDEGDQLALLHEDDNDEDPQAVAVMRDHSPLRVGYVPRPLAHVVHHVMGDLDHRLVVLHRNPRSADFHLRLLVPLEGRPRTEPFVGPEWETV